MYFFLILTVDIFQYVQQLINVKVQLQTTSPQLNIFVTHSDIDLINIFHYNFASRKKTKNKELVEEKLFHLIGIIAICIR